MSSAHAETKRRTRDRARAEDDPASDRSRADATSGGRAWLPAFISALLLWASFPPLDFWPLAWVAPLGWLWLCTREPLPGRRPWLALWLSGFTFWMGVLHFLRLPHPATSLGWVAISFYFAFYTPAFVWLTRRAIERWHTPLVIAAPVVWTGLELLRGHLLTGLTYGALGYTQFRWISLIQIADLAGIYGVSFVVMFVAAAIATLLFTARSTGRSTMRTAAVVAAVLLVGATLAYGYWRTSNRGEVRAGPKVALIQGSIDTELKANPNKRFIVHEQYMGLSQRALAEHPDVDLLVWPETMFRESLMTFDPDFRPPPDVDWNVDDARYSAQLRQEFLANTARELRVPAIIGIDHHHYGPGTTKHYNSAIHVDPTGAVHGRYQKMHRVMFGEYIPFGDWFPWLYKVTPVAATLTAGDGPQSFQVGKYRVAPNICFENILPHFVRWQVRELAARGEEPDFLVNLTNSGWFWGSSELDQQLTCGVFRAIEMRKPFLIAANTGFSASIDSDGRILAQGPRRDTDVVIANVTLDERRSMYARWGDLFAGLCLTFCGVIVGGAIVTHLRERRERKRLSEAA